ncbi:MAG: polyhydroxyalkanoate synthesis repressor PhaR [Zoogloeaceae bacterium]|jgi:polyhydroxyalkanoate synthesis repressor PhaR|nr:polyhydroxyalkanoate synthesis repressor PhaR [Zoogloeaceae bacterium]
MTEKIRQIKKYPNRRLYDTLTSRYITLSDIKEMVLKYDHFQVVDAKTDEDLTRSVLLQIVLDEESGGVPIFSRELLSIVIRLYGHAVRGVMGKYLESNIHTLLDFQQKFQEQSCAVFGENPQMPPDFLAQFLNFQQPAMQNVMSAYVEQGQKLLQQMREQIQNQTRAIFAYAPPESVEKPPR